MTRSARWLLGCACLTLAVVVGSFVAGPLLRGQNTAAPVVPKELYSYRDIVKKMLPAVVSIESKVKPANPVRMQRRRPDLDQIPEQFRPFFEGAEQPFEFPPQQPHVGFGSGFLVDPKGVILTNYHVVAGADQVEVDTGTTAASSPRKDIKTDRKTDLAIVRIDAKDAAALPGTGRQRRRWRSATACWPSAPRSA